MRRVTSHSTYIATEKPYAAPGLVSYRCRNRYGWTMIGAEDHDGAFREALRSDASSKRIDLQIWSGTAYVPCYEEGEV